MPKKIETAPSGADEPKLKTTAVDMTNDALKTRLAESQVKYPSWKPEHEGAILAGKIVEVKDYPFMHQNKGSIMAVVDTGLAEPDDMVAFWLNTVAQSQLLKLRNEKLERGENPVIMDADHTTRAEAIRELVGEEVIVQYTGEEKSQDKTKRGLNPYQKYVIVRNQSK